MRSRLASTLAVFTAAFRAVAGSVPPATWPMTARAAVRVAARLTASTLPSDTQHSHTGLSKTCCRWPRCGRLGRVAPCQTPGSHACQGAGQPVNFPFGQLGSRTLTLPGLNRVRYVPADPVRWRPVSDLGGLCQKVQKKTCCLTDSCQSPLRHLAFRDGPVPHTHNEEVRGSTPLSSSTVPFPLEDRLAD